MKESTQFSYYLSISERGRGRKEHCDNFGDAQGTLYQRVAQREKETERSSATVCGSAQGYQRRAQRERTIWLS